MKPNRAKVLAKRLYEIARRLDPPSAGHKGTFVALEGPAFVLGDKASERFADLLRDLLEEDRLGEKFAENVLQNRLYWALTRLNKKCSEALALAEIHGIAAEVANYSLEETVYIPVFGIELKTPRFGLGNVTFVRLTKTMDRRLRARGMAIIDRGKDPPEHKVAFRNAFASRALDPMRGKVVAMYRVVAEPERAKQRALDEVSRALELLRYAAPSLYTRSQGVHIGLEGEPTPGQRTVVLFSDKSVRFGGNWAGGLQPLVINQATRKHLRQLRVPTLSRLLREHPTSLNDFDTALIAAVHWFSNAQRQTELETAFQSLVTAVESLLTPRDGSPIGSALAENAAIVLGERLEERRMIKRRFKQLYQVRSGVSHGGGKAVTDLDYRELEFLAGALIVVLARFAGRLKARQELLDKLEEIKLGGGRLR